MYHVDFFSEGLLTPTAESATGRQPSTVTISGPASAVESHLTQGHTSFWPVYVDMLIDIAA